MARPERTDIRARHSLLSGDHSPLWGWGHDKLESFGFWGRKFCIKNAEILSVGKIAEFAKFAGEKTKVSRPLFFHILAEGRDIIDRKRIDILLELAETE